MEGQRTDRPKEHGQASMETTAMRDQTVGSLQLDHRNPFPRKPSNRARSQHRHHLRHAITEPDQIQTHHEVRRLRALLGCSGPDTDAHRLPDQVQQTFGPARGNWMRIVHRSPPEAVQLLAASDRQGM